MSKHTPGPWKYRGDLIGIMDDSDTQSYGSIRVICRIDDWDFKDQARANGHLIAAAPELLEALKGLIGVISETRGIPAYNAVLDAQKAIAKAEEQSCKS